MLSSTQFGVGWWYIPRIVHEQVLASMHMYYTPEHPCEPRKYGFHRGGGHNLSYIGPKTLRKFVVESVQNLTKR